MGIQHPLHAPDLHQPPGAPPLACGSAALVLFDQCQTLLGYLLPHPALLLDPVRVGDLTRKKKILQRQNIGAIRFIQRSMASI